MAGTKIGGLKASITNKRRYGNEFYANIGAIGGKNGTTGGFASETTCSGKCGLQDMFGIGHMVAKCAGYKGGMKSRRKSKKGKRS